MSTRFTDKTFHPGDELGIEWEVLVEHDAVDWDLYFSIDGGDVWEPIEEGLPLYQFTYAWVAPDIESDKMLIRIVQDNEITEDYADMRDPFVITSNEATAIQDVEAVHFKSSVSPNPVFSELNISLSLAHAGNVVFDIYDLSGHLLEEIRRPKLVRGDYLFRARADELPNGLLLLQTTVNGEVHMQRLLKLPDSH